MFAALLPSELAGIACNKTERPWKQAVLLELPKAPCAESGVTHWHPRASKERETEKKKKKEIKIKKKRTKAPPGVTLFTSQSGF